MPKIEELLNNELARGVAIGVGVATIAAFLLPAARPVARAALKTGLICLERGRELAAEAGEALEDLVAEVRAELASERMGAAEAVQASARTDAPHD